MPTLDELFTQVEDEARANMTEPTPEELAKAEARRKAEIDRGIRNGWLDANGDPIEQPEVEDDEDENPEEEE